MSESSGERERIQRILLNTFDSFFIRSGWHVTTDAQKIIEIGIHALSVDDLGMGEFTGRADRLIARRRAFKSLPDFLDLLAKISEDKSSELESKGIEHNRTIGAIMVIQQLPAWSAVADCVCWPR